MWTQATPGLLDEDCRGNVTRSAGIKWDHAMSAATGLWPLAVLLIKLEVTIVERGELALDEEVAHLRSDLERVAGGDDEIGNLAGFQRAEFFVEAEDLRGHKRDGFEGFVVRQPIGDSVGGKLAV